MRGVNALGVDFTGGDLVTLSFQEKIDDGRVRSALGNLAEVAQYQRSPVGEDEILSLRTAFGKGEPAVAKLQQDFPSAGFTQIQLDKVAPIVGEELKKNALIALILGVVGSFCMSRGGLNRPLPLGRSWP